MVGLDKSQRDRLWVRLIEIVEAYREGVQAHPVVPRLDPEAIRADLRAVDFARPLSPIAALDFAAEHLWNDQVHTPHPSYFGLFNPAPTTMGIAADTLTAAFNPQLAAWSHSPFAAEVERYLVRTFGGRFGYPADCADGVFCSGGAEANQTAVLTSLTSLFPTFADRGLRALDGQPTLYVSTESHHSFLKAARTSGLGTDAVRVLPADDHLRLDAAALSAQICADRQRGFLPFLTVATAGTTAAGVVDPIDEVGAVARSEGTWLHVDAAWGGAAALAPELRASLNGIELADSITFDAHKWLSVPMAAGMYLTRHPDILVRTFRTSNTYMPKDAVGLDIVDPFSQSLQWSRRFTGLKVFLSLAVAGWEGYAAVIRRQTAMGDLLRQELRHAGWRIVNETPLPVVCFVDAADSRPEHSEAIVRRVLASGQAWISTARIGGQTAIRACITNYRTGPDEVRGLVRLVGDARSAY
jgi:glutamate/tyrosine decarboxylase-like PLP-dependent enzyme